MGRMAAHTGQIITFDQMLHCPHEFAPDADRADDGRSFARSSGRTANIRFPSQGSRTIASIKSLDQPLRRARQTTMKLSLGLLAACTICLGAKSFSPADVAILGDIELGEKSAELDCGAKPPDWCPRL